MDLVCGKMQPQSNTSRKLGGSRYICGLPLRHEGCCGKWYFCSQPEAVEIEESHLLPITQEES